MALVLYDHPASSNALKVRFLLAELGLEYEKVHVPFARPRPEWLTGMHPFGTIPFFVDGDLGLGESNTILRYLADREGRRDLYPAGGAERARVDWLMDTWSTEVRPALLRVEDPALFYENVEEGGASVEGADPAAVAAALQGVDEPLERFEELIADDGTALGTFTIADCCVAPVLWRSLRLPISLERLPKLALLRETVTARPTFKAAGPVS